MIDGEDEFLDMLLADPNDDIARQVYADWLEDHGDPRAEWLRLELEHAGDDSTPDRRRLGRFATLRPQLDRSWCWLVTRDRLLP